MLKMTTFTLVLLTCSVAVANEPNSQVLFDFTNAQSGGQWQTVNDGVMGGRSDGRFKVGQDSTMEFYGTLSLKNNGGFASLRSRGGELDLREGDVLVARVRGDGRRYNMNLYVPRRRVAFSYRATLQTKKNEWIEVRLPLEDFVATSFGRVVRKAGAVDAQQISAVGFILADKKAGPFKLEVDWIKAEAAGSNGTK
jgi:NADH dehydrogenase [ubiquinone] 1 alpha subcomplex assembly factor 1